MNSKPLAVANAQGGFALVESGYEVSKDQLREIYSQQVNWQLVEGSNHYMYKIPRHGMALGFSVFVALLRKGKVGAARLQLSTIAGVTALKGGW